MHKKSDIPKSEDKNPRDKVKKLRMLVVFVILGGILLITLLMNESYTTGTITYTEFFQEVRNNNIEAVTVGNSAIVDVLYKPDVCQEEKLDEKTGLPVKYKTDSENRRIETVINPSDATFFKELAEADVEIRIAGAGIGSIIQTIIPLVYIGVIVFMLMTMRKSFGGNLRNSAIEVTQSKILFTDVAGLTEEKEELIFAINSLKNNADYISKGVKPVRGILLEGPPGVGKTLLAKAVAGEAGVKFLSCSGSDFVEMFAGLGASRVRSMYKKAVEMKPCVVFIDEIDALGRKRIAGGNGGTQEADQTLVALLERMDGINTNDGILFIGATNRVDSLDAALLRPGRFDKIIHVGPPKTKADREAIVRVHSKDKSFAEGVSVEAIAKHCYGMTGAEIAASLNDAVLESFRADRQGIIALEDIDKAVMKMYTKGLAKGRHTPEDLYTVAIHEAGHTLMNLALNRKVVKVSIQPYSNGVGGVTLVDGDSTGIEGIRKKSDIITDIKVLYASKAAEEIIFNENTVGVTNDLERATQLIKECVAVYGMQKSNLLALNALSSGSPLEHIPDKILDAMSVMAETVYADVEKFFANSTVQCMLKQIADKLVNDEVLYSLDFVDIEALKRVI